MTSSSSPHQNPKHDRQRTRLGRFTRKGPDGVTLKPGRHVVGMETRYDGSGGSGHIGPCSSSTRVLHGSTAEQKVQAVLAEKKRRRLESRRRARKS